MRASITGLKNHDRRARVTELADGLAALAPDTPGLVVTWAPTERHRRRRQRGFDQAELLARAVARRRRLPVRGLLTRRPGAPQAGQAAGERWRHPGFSARARAPEVVLAHRRRRDHRSHARPPPPGPSTTPVLTWCTGSWWRGPPPEHPGGEV